MKYEYVRRTPDEIRKIARVYLERFPSFRYGHAVDVERIQEELGFEVIYRKNLGIADLQGYVAQAARYIVVSDLATGPRLRYTIAHELSHKILEHNLWENGAIPEGANSHELTDQQHDDIEADAWSLASELIEPFPEFANRFNAHLQASLDGGSTRLQAVHYAVSHTASDFDVIRKAAALRAKRLGLMSPDEHSELFAVIL